MSTALPFALLVFALLVFALLVFAFRFAAAALGAFSVLMPFASDFILAFALVSAFVLALAFAPDFASDVVPAVFFCWRLGCSSGSSSAEPGGVERTGR